MIDLSRSDCALIVFEIHALGGVCEAFASAKLWMLVFQPDSSCKSKNEYKFATHCCSCPSKLCKFLGRACPLLVALMCIAEETL